MKAYTFREHCTYFDIIKDGPETNTCSIWKLYVGMCNMSLTHRSKKLVEVGEKL